MAARPPTRLSKEARRDQLLDVAAHLLTDGVSALTMEGLAVAAGVSKALPYAHFENADGVMVALYEREVFHLGAAVIEAVEGEPPGDDRMRAAIRAYFDYVGARGAVLSILTSAGSRAPEALDPRIGPDFVGQLLVDSYPLRRPEAARLGELLIGCLTTASAMWARSPSSRRLIERTTTSFVLAGIHEAAAPQR